jgi:acetoacetyl-CoA reductase
MLGLENKVILVTGGNRGIGEATVDLLGQFGAKVAYVNQSSSGKYGELFIKADVTKKEEISQAILQIEDKLGPIYGVVANAGITKDNLFQHLTDEEWHQVMNVNVNGVYNTIKELVPGFYERKEGAIVFVSSIVGESGNMGQANYAASKAALIGLAKSLAKEGARYNVRTNVVSPGFTETDMTSSIPEKVKEKIVSSIPFRRFAQPEEIAWAIAFMLSPKSSYITGEVLRVNGGQLT